MSTWMTSNAPPWLVLLLLGVVATAYLAGGALALAGRLRHRTPVRPARGPRPLPARARTGARTQVTS